LDTRFGHRFPHEKARRAGGHPAAGPRLQPEALLTYAAALNSTARTAQSFASSSLRSAVVLSAFAGCVAASSRARSSRDEWDRVDSLPALGNGRGKAVSE